MRKVLIYLILILPLTVFSQVNFEVVSGACNANGEVLVSIDLIELENQFGPLNFPFEVRWFNKTDRTFAFKTIENEAELQFFISNLTSGEYEFTLKFDSSCEEYIGEFTINQEDYTDYLEFNISNAILGDCNNGSIDLELDEFLSPLQYSWSNGATTQDISGLSEGIYCVTIVDASCGLISECFELNCQCFAASPVIEPNILGSGDVYYNISIPDFSDISGWVTLNFFINGTFNNDRDLTNSDSSFDTPNLSIGDLYCLEFVSKPGTDCSFELCRIVEGQTCSDNLLVSLNSSENSCENDATGSISTSLFNVPCGDYTGIQSTWFSADDGSVVSSTFTLDNVKPGTYCQEVKSPEDCNEDCTTVKCFEVGVEGPSILDADIVQPFYCHDERNQIFYLVPGKISISTLIGNPSGFEWYHEGEIVGTGSSIDIPLWAAGEYCVTYSDECFEELQQCYQVSVDPIIREKCSRVFWRKRLPGVKESEVSSALKADSPNYKDAYNSKDQTWSLVKIDQTKFFEIFNGNGKSTAVALEPLFEETQTRENLQPKQDYLINGVKAYPSPFEEILNIEYQSSTKGPTSVKLLSLDGKLIYSKTLESTIGFNENSLELSELDYQGILLLEISLEGSTSILKVVKM